MDLKKAIGILETHNRWRRGEDVEPELKPRDIGIAIDTVVEHVKNNGVLDDVINCDSCAQEITVFAEQGTKKYCRECA